MAIKSALVVMFLVLVSVAHTQGQVVPLAPAPSPMAMAPGPAAPAPYYISYGALSANRAPCPSGTGQSYYAANCTAQTGPVTPYTRSCDTITRCARG